MPQLRCIATRRPPYVAPFILALSNKRTI